MNPLFFVFIGLMAGVLSGLFGIGGGILIVPALIYGMGFSQKTATGTSLAILLPPVGIAAVMQYYREDHVDFRAALLIAAAMLAGSWFGAKFVNQFVKLGIQVFYVFGVALRRVVFLQVHCIF